MCQKCFTSVISVTVICPFAASIFTFFKFFRYESAECNAQCIELRVHAQYMQFCGFNVFRWLIKPGSLMSHDVT